MEDSIPEYLDWSNAFEILEKAHEQGIFVLVIGPKGTGKTTLVREFAKKQSMKLESINFSLRTRESHLVGSKSLSEGNIELLSEKIPEALKKANKNQDILFEVFQLRKKFWLLPTTIDTTAGYLFIEPGKINIIFEKVNEDYQGYDYDIVRMIVGKSSEGIYSGKYKISKGWIVLTSKSWN